MKTQRKLSAFWAICIVLGLVSSAVAVTYYVYTPITNVSITSHNDYDSVSVGQSYTLTCSTSTDKDSYCDGGGWHYPTDNVIHTWSGPGTFTPQTGTSVSWIPPRATGNVTITVTASDNSSPAYANDTDKSDSVILTVQNSLYYVDVDATGSNNGTSWANAYNDLQDALDAVSSGDEIWVAEGTYKPSDQYTPTVARSVTFQLVDGVAIYGGFDATESLRSQRDYATNETILSGDIGTAGVDTDNAYHVITSTDATGVDTIFDGFTITKGYADGSYPANNGGGIYFDDYYCSVTVKNCVISNNYADAVGGGLYISSHKDYSPTISNCFITDNQSKMLGGGIYVANGAPDFDECTISNNEVGYLGGGSGGGMFYMGSDGDSKITNCIFEDNTSESVAGSLYLGVTTVNKVFKLDISNCVFSGNTSESIAGAIHISTPFNSSGDLTITNCLFNDNSSGSKGGAIYNYCSSPDIANCTFVENTVGDGPSSSYGGAMYNRYANYGDASPVVTNCIFWDNIALTDGNEIYNETNCDPSFSYSDIKGGLNGINCGGADSTDDGGNISSDPNFVNIFDFTDITVASGTTTTIKVTDANLYDVDDEIEYNNDGVARKVTTVNTTTDIVTFANDALSASSESYKSIFNWGSGATDMDEDLHIISTSGCKDAGDPNGTYTGQKDMDGEDRVNGTYVDIGADEYYSN